MEIGFPSTFSATNLENLSFSRERSASNDQPLNAFGIGTANQPEVELSPQARILQQNEQTQNERREALGQDRVPEQAEEEDANPAPVATGTDFVRISSSVGSAARNNLSTERATEVYRSIQELL